MRFTTIWSNSSESEEKRLRELDDRQIVGLGDDRRWFGSNGDGQGMELTGLGARVLKGPFFYYDWQPNDPLIERLIYLLR